MGPFFYLQGLFGLLSGGMTIQSWQGEGDMTHGMIRVVQQNRRHKKNRH